MKTILFSAQLRGHQHHGWLDARHTFSFAGYYHPQRVHFGALRVLNDDVVQGGQGFGEHPHQNMEIITIPLEGQIAHADSTGARSVMGPGEVQVMSAGTGIYHSEYNAHAHQPLNLFQLWIFSNKQNVEPRYDTKAFDFLSPKEGLTLIVSPHGEQGSLWVHQDAWLSIGTLATGTSLRYTLHKPGHGVFAMVIEGQANVAGQPLHRRDALGLWEVQHIDVEATTTDTRILLIEVPMEHWD